MKRLLRVAIEQSVRSAFGVDIYPDAFEKLAIIDQSRRLSGMFRHKLRPELREHPLLFIHVPKNFRDHRSYQYWTVTNQQVDGADRCLKDGQPPFRWMEEANPPNRLKRRKPLKGYGYKQSI